LNPVRVDKRLVKVLSQQQAEEYEFVVDEASAYCDEGGARGSMEIPVPPGASKVVAFRIAGETEGKVTVHLYRTGWNVHDQKGERTPLMSRTITSHNFYDHASITEGYLDESHTLAVSVFAENRSTIWLIAARFE
jgi:hypothetical protein